MIEFYLGKTGGGKSYYALKKIVEFLLETDGYVVTNLALKLGELNAYFQRKYPNKDIDVCGRVRLLDDSEAKMFYLHRESGNDIAPVSKRDEEALKFPLFEEACLRSRHVLYVIDETHIYYDARAWATVGATLNFFCSQHRKFRCDIVFVTQFLDQVEKRLRLHAVQFSECVNWGMRRFSLWKMPKCFRVRLTYKAPPCPSENTETYQLDPQIAACYDTTAGVGVKGGRPPEPVRVKGLPWWTAFIGLGLAALAIAYLPDLAVWGFTGVMPGSVPKNSEKNLAESSLLPEATVSTSASPPTLEPLRMNVPVMDSEVVWITGILRKGQNFILCLSDGTLRTQDDNLPGEPPRITSVGPTFADIDGKRYYLKPRPTVQKLAIADPELESKGDQSGSAVGDPDTAVAEGSRRSK